jgi:hypothetical protein
MVKNFAARKRNPLEIALKTVPYVFRQSVDEPVSHDWNSLMAGTRADLDTGLRILVQRYSPRATSASSTAFAAK